MDKDDIYYRAWLSKDPRFDGKFYIAVKTTGIYCRPICPAKPKRENIVFYPDAFSAEKEGFRPCLRCHPEFSPDSMAWLGKSAIVQRALSLISQNALFETDIEAFAVQLGVSGRHLRRLFETEIGLSAKQISDRHRLNFAQKLIFEAPHLTLTTIALASGFSSLRRFNDAFKQRYHLPPSKLRKSKTVFKENEFILHLAYRPPLDWDHLLLYFSKHKIPFVEEISKTHYQRVFKVDSSIGVFCIANDAQKSQLVLKVHCQDPKVLFTVGNRVRKMFDLNSDPLLIQSAFSISSFSTKLWQEFPGLRIAKGWDTFEIAIGTILGQVVSVQQASNLMGELVKNYGEKILHPLTNKTAYLFPTPKALANASLDEIKTTTHRKNAIRELSQLIIENNINFSEHQDLDRFKRQLKSIKGIGEWSAEYISLRGLGDTNAFPKEDLILKRALSLNTEILDPHLFEPWRGYLAIYLWKKYAEQLSKQRQKNEPA